MGKAKSGGNSAKAARDAGTGIVGHRRVGAGENAVPAGAGDVAGIGDIGKANDGVNSAQPVMVAPALLVTVALVKAEMPSPLVPVMLPELATLAKPVLARIPYWPPVMLAAA